MKLVSLNIGEVEEYKWRGGVKSAIAKHPVEASLMLSEYGLEGDQQADLKVHGGRDKAVLVIPEKNYTFLKVFEHPFGFLGENLTLSEIKESDVYLGDRFYLGDVVLEVTQPRSPCWKLGELTESSRFVKTYSESGRVGFYCRVLQTGKVQQDMDVRHESKVDSVSIQSLFLAKFHHQTERDSAVITLALTNPALSEDWRLELERLLKRIQQSHR